MSGVKVGAQSVTMRVDVALTMLDDMQKQLDTLTRAVHAMAEAMVVIEDAHKLTNAYPFANARKFYLLDKAGVFDDQRTEAQKKRSMDWKEG